MKYIICIAALLLATHAQAFAQTKTCKTRAGAETMSFDENIETLTIGRDEELLSASQICGLPVSQDCATNSLKDSRLHVKNVHCAESDSHAEFIFSVVNGNGRFECRNGREQRLVEFYDCELN